jgi:RimJ/RimL family protein N-acetyltransferase
VLKLRAGVGVAPLTLEMAPQVFSWVSDPEVAGHLGLRSEPSLAKTEAWLARATSDDSLRGFAILLDGRHVGNVVLDLVDRQLSARGAGVGTTAVYHCLHEAFENLGLAKVWLVVHVHNAPAIVAYTRLGFQVEGVLREEFVLDGERVSALRMGILRREFRRLAERAAPTP